jgi:hypothetical protein
MGGRVSMAVGRCAIAGEARAAGRRVMGDPAPIVDVKDCSVAHPRAAGRRVMD